MRDPLIPSSFREQLAGALLGLGLSAFVGCSSGSGGPGPAGGGAGGAGVAGAAGHAGNAGSPGGAAGNTDVTGAAGHAGSGGGAAGATGTAGASGTSGGGPDAGLASDAGAGGSAPFDGGADASPTSDGPRANLALAKPATASSVEHAGHEPNMINDGDQVTRWVGGTDVYPQWSAVDLQSIHRVDTVVVWPYMSRAYQFLLEGSLDGASYVTLADWKANTTGGTSIPVPFPAQSARYVRITIVGASGYDAGWSAINELQIFEAR